MDLSQDILAALTPEDKQELEIWEELLASRGYDLLVRFLTGNAESVAAIIENANNWDQYVYARGSRDALNLVLNLEEILAARLTQTAEENVEVAEDPTLDQEFDEISVNLGL